MPEPTPRSRLPKVSPEQRRAAAGQYKRTNQVLKEDNLDYAIQLLLSCCKLDPITPVYRQTLRKAEKAKYLDKGKGQKLAFLTGLPARLRLKKASMKGDYLRVLDEAEQIFLRNPWDLGAHLAMAEAFEGLDLPEMALWTLDQVRQDQPNNPKVNRPMARLYEKRPVHPGDGPLGPRSQSGPQRPGSGGQAQGPRRSIHHRQGQIPGGDSGTVHRPLGASPTAETATEQPALGQTEAQMPAYADRVEREAHALRVKIQNNPTNPNGYLHLANVYRRADQFDKGRTACSRRG